MTKRILFLVSGLGVGGAELHTLALRSGLAGGEFETRLAVYGTRFATAMEARPGAEDAVRLGIRGMSSIRGWWRLWRLLHREKPDVVVAVNQTPLVASVLVRGLGATRARIACIYHTTILRPGDERAQSRFRSALRYADALVYVSERQAAYSRGTGLACDHEIVITNGVDFDRFRPMPAERAAMREKLGVAANEVVFGIVASLWAEKNHLQVVEALATLRRRSVPARAVFVGDGPMRAQIEARAQELGVAGALFLAGDVADVRPFLAAMDVGVLPSTAVETFSLAALECLATGVPMVMSDIGGAGEIVLDGVNGLLVPPGDLAALVAALERMAEPDQRRTMTASARGSIETFSRERMLEAYRQLFRKLTR